MANLDYCNSLVTDVPQMLLAKFEMVVNCAACLVCRASKHEHNSPPLVDLHWLPVCHRIQYKIATVYYNVISSSAPPCLADRLRLYTPSQTLGSSADLRIFCIPIRCKRFHKQRIFCYTGPVIWNSLPFPVHHFQRLLSFSSTVGSAVLRSQFISVHACMHVYMHVSVCVCVCVCVYKCDVGWFGSDLG